MEQLKSMRTSRATAQVRLIMPTKAQRERFANQKASVEKQQQARRDLFDAQLNNTPIPSTESREEKQRLYYERKRKLLEKLWHRQADLVSKLPKAFSYEKLHHAQVSSWHACVKLCQKAINLPFNIYAKINESNNKK